jgi:hypothetical protein
MPKPRMLRRVVERDGLTLLTHETHHAFTRREPNCTNGGAVETLVLHQDQVLIVRVDEVDGAGVDLHSFANSLHRDSKRSGEIRCVGNVEHDAPELLDHCQSLKWWGDALSGA